LGSGLFSCAVESAAFTHTDGSRSRDAKELHVCLFFKDECVATILERIRLEAARELHRYDQAARISECTGLDFQDALIAARWWPLVPGNPKRPIDARPNAASSSFSQNTPVPLPASERERLAEACLELIRNWPRYKSVMRYSGGAGHDVSRQPRNNKGEWIKIGGDPDSANTEQLRRVLERFRELHPLQAQYAADIKLAEEAPSLMNWDNPLHWHGTTLKVRAGTSDFEVLFELASTISQCKGYKEWLVKQIESEAIKVPYEHPKLWPDGTIGAALQQKEKLKEWYKYMEAAGATPAEIEHVKWSRGLNEWFGPGGYAETTLGAVGTVAGALNVRRGGDGGPLLMREKQVQTPACAAPKKGLPPSALKNNQGNAPKSVTVKHKSHGDVEEFTRQLKAQEDAINKLTAGEIKAAIEKFRAEGRPSSAAAANKQARKAAPEAAKGKAALHNPDPVVGGRPDVVEDFGGKSENSSIGIQNRWLQPEIYEAVKDLPPQAKIKFDFTTK